MEGKNSGEVGSQSDRLTNKPSSTDYYSGRPKAIHLSRRLLLRALVRYLRTLRHLLVHTISVFDEGESPKRIIESASPPGKLSRGQISWCEHISSLARDRATRIESKASAMLSAISIVVPIAMAALAVGASTSRSSLPTFTLATATAGAILLLVALVASIRALAIRSHHVLSIDTVLDVESDTVRRDDPNWFGRALLSQAVSQEVMNDHMADFVRAAQQLLSLGVVVLGVSISPLLWSNHASSSEPPDVAPNSAIGVLSASEAQPNTVKPPCPALTGHQIRQRLGPGDSSAWGCTTIGRGVSICVTPDSSWISVDSTRQR